MSFADELVKELASSIRIFGFSGTSPKRRLSGEVVQSVGFVRQTFSRGSVVTVMPVLGVTFVKLRATGEDLGLFDPKYRNPSLNVGLGQLPGATGKTDYRFEVGVNSADEIEEFQKAFKRDGLSFFEKTDSINKARSYLHDGFNDDGSVNQCVRDVYTFIPLAHLVNENRKSAILCARKMLNGMTPGRGLEPKLSRFVELLSSDRDC